jgi:hypothetical protein
VTHPWTPITRQENIQKNIMSSETPDWNESLRTLWVSSTLSCLAKAKLFLGESLGDGREEDDKGEEDRSLKLCSYWTG